MNLKKNPKLLRTGSASNSSKNEMAKKNFGRFNVAESKCGEESKPPHHEMAQSKETGGIEVVANLEDSQCDSSHNNMSARENKSEIEAHHLSFSDTEKRKRSRINKQVRSPLLQKSGEDLSRTFEMGTDDNMGVKKRQKGKTVVFESG